MTLLIWLVAINCPPWLACPLHTLSQKDASLYTFFLARSVGTWGKPVLLWHPATQSCSSGISYFQTNHRSGPGVHAKGFRPACGRGKAVDHGQPRPRTAAVFFEPMSKRRRGFPSETQV